MLACTSGGTPSLKGYDNAQNNLDHLSSGDQLREILSFGKIQDKLLNKIKAETSNEPRESASFSIGSMVPPLKNFIVNRDSDLFVSNHFGIKSNLDHSKQQAKQFQVACFSREVLFSDAW